MEKAIQTLLIVFISYPFGKLIVSSIIYDILENCFTFYAFKFTIDKYNEGKLCSVSTRSISNVLI